MPRHLVKMKSGYAMMGNIQFLPGYCILSADPEIKSLNDLTMQQRADFLLDMGLLGDAIIAACAPVRINYGILANSWPSLHAHLFPRYEWEPEEMKTKNVWRYPEDGYWADEKHAFDPDKHGHIQEKIAVALKEIMEQAYGSSSF